ncbi:TniB family NTP-binding protein [Endozoicomonas sp. Mp262]|uniref:TniB family NTP-binding protein n=1 Tax=Endozoicomonas sp. Mp262 TaxID=2919499 RepID=UPI0021D9CCCF
MKKEDIWIEYANYKPQSLSRYQGNKFIEALPLKLGIEDFIATSIRDPEYKDSERFLPNSERCQAPFALKDWFMPTNNHVQLYDNIDLLIRNGYVERQKRSRSYPLPPAAAALIGVAGTGKSYGNMHVLNCYPDIIIHDTEKYPQLPRYQLPKLVITAPEDGDTKRIPELVYKALSALLSEHLNIRINKNDDMKFWMKQFSVGMLVVEEIQFLLQLGVNNYDPVINALVSLCNELCVPLVFIGTMDIRKIFEGSLAQSRRVQCTNMPYWLPFHRVATHTEQNPSSQSLHPNFIEFMEEMWPYQWTQDKTELTADILEAFYEATAGIPDFMVKLFQLTQIQLMNDKEQEKRSDERMTPQYIEDVANKYFDIAMPKIRAIRNRTPEDLDKYPDMDFTGLPEIQQLAKDLMIAPEEPMYGTKL